MSGFRPHLLTPRILKRIENISRILLIKKVINVQSLCGQSINELILTVYFQSSVGWFLKKLMTCLHTHLPVLIFSNLQESVASFPLIITITRIVTEIICKSFVVKLRLRVNIYFCLYWLSFIRGFAGIKF